MSAPDFRNEASAAYEARRDLGPEYEGAILESFVERAAESIDQRVDARFDALLAERGIGKTRQGQGDAQIHLAIWSVLGGVGGSIGLMAGAGAGAEAPLVVWLGIAAVNFAYALRRR